nr:MAG TPA: hypothetical protein [Caudoviricetes sp.]
MQPWTVPSPCKCRGHHNFRRSSDECKLDV